MKQAKLEEKVRELFERQGFELDKGRNSFTAEKNGMELELKVFSGEEYSVEEVVDSAEAGEKVFVDEELSGVKDEIENEVSVIEEEGEQEEYETPSYEVIGDIAVINDLAGVNQEEAVEGILQHQNVKTILLKKGGLEGEFRVGDYEKLYGEETETVHTEFGCRYKVDPTKVYFSERFGTERERVVNQAEDGEKVLVMFAGVGPFAVLAGKKANPEKVTAVEKNPEGAEYLKENIELNNVEDVVEGVQGDVEEVVPELGKFDRIVMPLPESADKYLELAMEHLEEGGTIHYYRFLDEENWEELEKEVEDSAGKAGVEYEIVNRVECGERGPSVKRVCIEIKRK